MKKKKAVKYEEILEGAFGFNDYTVEYNGRGEYSEGQRIYFAQRVRLNRVLAVLFALSNFVALFWLANSNLYRHEIAIFFLVVFLVNLFAVMLERRAYKMQENLKDNQLEVVEGRVQLGLSTTQHGTTYEMQIGDTKFNIHGKQFFALKNGDPYRVYYMPATKQILSVEWLYSEQARDVISTGEAIDQDAFALIDDFSEEVLLRKRK